MTQATKRRRGMATVDDVKAKCIVDPATHCWIWTGAFTGACGDSPGLPALHAFDHARGEKRTMSGPLAVWNIAHGAAPTRALVYRCCHRRACLNPAHLREAWSLAEVGEHIRLSGAFRGQHLEAKRANAKKGRVSQGIVDTPADIVAEVLSLPQERTGRSIAKEYGLHEKTVSRLRVRARKSQQVAA